MTLSDGSVVLLFFFGILLHYKNIFRTRDPCKADRGLVHLMKLIEVFSIYHSLENQYKLINIFGQLRYNAI